MWKSLTRIIRTEENQLRTNAEVIRVMRTVRGALGDGKRNGGFGLATFLVGKETIKESVFFFRMVVVFLRILLGF